jgi:rhodanese-related sulfurtransferase
MLEGIRTIFGEGSGTDLKKLVQRGAIVLDVRSSAEFARGHLIGAVNIPLNALNNQITRLKRDKPIIICCASGIRSASARNVLLANGFKDVYDAGRWTSLLKYTSKA